MSPREYTIFVCPACGYWHGRSEGLWAKPSRCAQCIQKRMRRRPDWHPLTTRDIEAAPLTEPLVLSVQSSGDAGTGA